MTSCNLRALTGGVHTIPLPSCCAPVRSEPSDVATSTGERLGAVQSAWAQCTACWAASSAGLVASLSSVTAVLPLALTQVVVSRHMSRQVPPSPVPAARPSPGAEPRRRQLVEYGWPLECEPPAPDQV